MNRMGRDFLIDRIEWSAINSNTYLITGGRAAGIVIDPVDEHQVYKALADKKVLEHLHVILTHEHFDHISGLTELRKRYPCRVYANKICSRRIQSVECNLSLYANVIRFFDNDMKGRQKDISDFSCKPADIIFDNEFRFDWMGHTIYLKSIPGHSPGSIGILMDEKYLFSGDSLLADYGVITRLPGGSRKQYAEYAVPFFERLPKDVLVYPGHGKSGYLGELLEFWMPGILKE